MAYTLEQLRQMGAQPVATAPQQAQGYTFEELQKLGASPVEQKDPGILRTIGASITRPFEKLSASAQKYGGGAVAYGLDVLTPSKKTFSSFKEATQKVGSGYDKGAFSATKALTGETPQPVRNIADLAGTSLEAASIVAPVVKAPAFLGKIAKGKIGQAAVEGGLTAGASGFLGGTGRGLQDGKDVVGSLERGVVEGAIAAPFGLALGGVAGGLVRAPKLATKSGRQQVALQSAKEQFAKDLDDVLSSKSLSKATSELEKANVPIREILSDMEVAQGIKVVNKAINVDDAVAVTQKNLDLAQNAKAKLLPEIDKFAPKVSKEEIRAEAIKDIVGKETSLDEKGLIRRINAQIDALDNNLSLSQIDAERRKFYNSGRTAKGEQRGDSEYAAIENALRKILFDKTDNLPQEIATNDEIRGLNTYIRQQLKAQQFLDKNLRGQTVKGGKLGEYFARGIGAVAGSQGGVLGSLAGSEIAGYVSNVLTNNKLGSSVKMRLIQNAAEETADPQIIKAANELIKKLKLKPQLQLPAPSTGFRSVVPSQNTIQLGANTADELPAQVINRNQSIPSISRQNTANTIMTTNANTSIPTSLQQVDNVSSELSTPKTLPKDSIKNVSPLSLSKNLKVTNAYGDSFLGFNLKGMEKRANENGYNLYDNLLKRVDAEDDMTKKIEAMQDILEEIMVAKPKKGMLQSAIDNLKDPKMRQGGYIRNPLAKKELPVQKSSSLNDTTDLIQEAKKYKSAEEFVKAQPKLYHGGSADIKDIQLGKSNFQKTFYMSENPDYAKSFGGNKSSLNEIMVDSKAKLADLRKPSDDLVKQIEDIISSKPTGKTVRIQKPDGTFLEIPETKGGLSNPVHSSKDILNGIMQGKAYFAEMPEVKKALKKLGYDGMITQESKMGANFGVWNKDILKTKSQLTDIWNKAQGKSLSNDLIEASVASKLPPRTAERMKPNFTPELKKNIAEIIDAQRGIKKVSPEKMIELEADMSSIIEDFGLTLPRTKAGRLKLLDLIYNQAI